MPFKKTHQLIVSVTFVAGIMLMASYCFILRQKLHNLSNNKPNSQSYAVVVPVANAQHNVVQEPNTLEEHAVNLITMLQSDDLLQRIYTTNMVFLMTKFIEAECVKIIASINFGLHYNLDCEHLITNRCGIYQLERFSMHNRIRLWVANAIYQTTTNVVDEFTPEYYLESSLRHSREDAVYKWAKRSGISPPTSYQNLIGGQMSPEEKIVLDLLSGYYSSIFFQELYRDKIRLLAKSPRNRLTSIASRIVASEPDRNFAKQGDLNAVTTNCCEHETIP